MRRACKNDNSERTSRPIAKMHGGLSQADALDAFCNLWRRGILQTFSSVVGLCVH